ncbi:uncharacterized protein [Palaemon carinicauda]|uniref:uncharacterized protein n=1 Tax=Palaemon carinicauda TaxID=392227 RepID=UPI0035B5823B
MTYANDERKKAKRCYYNSRDYSDLPDEVPTISGGRSKYHVGDEVHVNCTSARSRPAASLIWYINDQQAESRMLVQYAPVNDSDGLETSRLGLRFIVGPRHFPSGELKLRCTATIAAVYWQSSEESVEGQLPQTGPALESKGVYTGGCYRILPSWWIGTFCLMGLWLRFPVLLRL